MKKEMISVIIPIYNRDYCLSRCLESVVQNILYRTDSNIVDLMDKKAFELFAGPICKLYDRSIIETNGIRFPVGISWGEDLIFNCAYYRYVDCLKGITLHLYHVLKQENSLTEEARGHFCT